MGRRRGLRGNGSITVVNGRHVARYSTTEGGIRKRVAKTFDSRNEAEWWLSQSRRHGESPEDIRVRDYMDRWLKGKRNVVQSTRDQYTNHVRVHINPVLGGHKLVALRRRHVEAFVEDRLSYSAPRSKKPGAKQYPLSPATVGKILTTLRTALEEAVPQTIPDNPAAKVEAPKVDREPVRAMTREEAAAVVDSVRGTWLEHPVRVMLGSGLRIGEVVALNQGDVNDGWVRLRKSKTTIRAVRLSDDANEAIHEAIRIAPRRGKSEPVFFGPRSGDRLGRHSVTHALKKSSAMTSHGLRHGTATLLVAGGVHMRIVAEQLGHANPAMTARVYAHVAPESVKDALGVLDEAVGHR